jgi:hypothetical protein
VRPKKLARKYPRTSVLLLLLLLPLLLLLLPAVEARSGRCRHKPSLAARWRLVIR